MKIIAAILSICLIFPIIIGGCIKAPASSPPRDSTGSAPVIETPAFPLISTTGPVIHQSGQDVPVNSGQREGEGLALYLTKKGLIYSQMVQTSIDEVELAEQPFISGQDVVSYEKSAHVLELTPEAYDRVKKIERASSLGGSVFMVCLDHKLIYWGIIKNMLSSATIPRDVVNMDIWFAALPVPSPSGGKSINRQVIQLNYQGDMDPRSNPGLMEYLEKDGKLK